VKGKKNYSLWEGLCNDRALQWARALRDRHVNLLSVAAGITCWLEFAASFFWCMEYLWIIYHFFEVTWWYWTVPKTVGSPVSENVIGIYFQTHSSLIMTLLREIYWNDKGLCSLVCMTNNSQSIWFLFVHTSSLRVQLSCHMMYASHLWECDYLVTWCMPVISESALILSQAVCQ
jgi:hypothetical protein